MNNGLPKSVWLDETGKEASCWWSAPNRIATVEYVPVSRLREAEEKISALQQEVEGGSWAYVKQVEELKERERILREALEWYADVDNYVGAFSHDGCATSADKDGGFMAREVLAVSVDGVIPEIPGE